jgi:hypothetical protein
MDGKHTLREGDGSLRFGALAEAFSEQAKS